MPQRRINHSPLCIPLCNIHSVYFTPPSIHPSIHTCWCILCASLPLLRMIRVKPSELTTTDITQSQFGLLHKQVFYYCFFHFLKFIVLAFWFLHIRNSERAQMGGSGSESLMWLPSKVGCGWSRSLAGFSFSKCSLRASPCEVVCALLTHGLPRATELLTRQFRASELLLHDELHQNLVT